MAIHIEAEIEKQLQSPGLGEEEREFLTSHLADFRDFNAQAAQAGSAEQVAFRKFSTGSLKDLRRNKAHIFEDPFNTSLSRLVAANKQFRYITNRKNEHFMNILSMSSQVAIFPEPRGFYVPESNNLSLDGHKRRLGEDMEEEIQGKMRIGGVDMIIGDVATHAGLVFAYFDQTRGRVRLHGSDYNYRYARTETPTVGSYVALVGHFRRVLGLRVVVWRRGLGLDDVWALRLVVPAQE